MLALLYVYFNIIGLDSHVFYRIFSNLLYNTNHQPTAEDFQIRLYTDRYKGTEILFQPSIVGLENAGIGEILEIIMGQMKEPLKR